MARVRTAFGHDQFISNVPGVPVITSTDVEVDDELLDALSAAAESADVMLVVNAPVAETSAVLGSAPVLDVANYTGEKPVTGLVDGTTSEPSEPAATSDPSGQTPSTPSTPEA